MEEKTKKRLIFWGLMYLGIVLILIMMFLDIQKLDKCASAIVLVNQNHTCDACKILIQLGFLTSAPSETTSFPVYPRP